MNPISRFPVPELNDIPEDLRTRMLDVQQKAGFLPWAAEIKAALQSMEADGVGAAFERAMQAACQRADELGNEFGA